MLLVLWPVWPRSGSGGFPSCEARNSRELVRQAIEGADDRGRVHWRLLALDGIRELGINAEKWNRMCVGEAVLNSSGRCRPLRWAAAVG